MLVVLIRPEVVLGDFLWSVGPIRSAAVVVVELETPRFALIISTNLAVSVNRGDVTVSFSLVEAALQALVPQ